MQGKKIRQQKINNNSKINGMEREEKIKKLKAIAAGSVTVEAAFPGEIFYSLCTNQELSFVSFVLKKYDGDTRRFTPYEKGEAERIQRNYKTRRKQLTPDEVALFNKVYPIGSGDGRDWKEMERISKRVIGEVTEEDFYKSEYYKAHWR